MHANRFRWALWGALAVVPALCQGVSRSAAKPAAECRQEVLDGEVHAGEAYTRAIGNGLQLLLQPIHSGWILRVIPVSGFHGQHDYAELATPPYHSVTPLSISTDFSFRAQDAVGWNPRQFRFASSQATFERLSAAYAELESAGKSASPALQGRLAEMVAQAPQGSVRILDARLVPGTADQWQMAAAVASHFTSTAHTLEQPLDGRPSPLGKLLWVRFRIELDLPPDFHAAQDVKVQSRACDVQHGDKE